MRSPRVRSLVHSVRFRVTAVAATVIACTVIAGLVGLYLLQLNSVRRTLDSQLRTYAAQIAESGAGGHWPRPLPPSSLDNVAEAQVLDVHDRVITATSTLLAAPAVYETAPGSLRPVRQKAATGRVPTDIRVLAVRSVVDHQYVTIVVGTGTGVLTTLNSEALRHLLLAVPVILVLAVLVIWLVVGRALGPVERIRRAVTDISLSDLSRRVPAPRSADEVGQLAETMNSMLGRLDESARRQRRFVADASHELRSPLAAIRTTLDVALAHPDRAPWVQIAQRAIGQSGRLEALIDELLLLARADERRLAAESAPPIDVAQAVDSALAVLREDLASRNIDVVVDLPAGVAVSVAERHLHRVALNLLGNASRFARHRIRVSGSCSEQDGRRPWVRVTVADDGPGIPPDDRERVFDRFVRLDVSRARDTGSSGLGLAIAKEIVVAYGGSIRAAASRWGGAELVVELPRAARPGALDHSSCGTARNAV